MRDRVGEERAREEEGLRSGTPKGQSWGRWPAAETEEVSVGPRGLQTRWREDGGVGKAEASEGAVGGTRAL